MSEDTPKYDRIVNVGDKYPTKATPCAELVASNAESPHRSGLSFGDAIVAAKQGNKIAREGWNGKNMFVWLKPAAKIPVAVIQDPILKELAIQNNDTLSMLGTLCMRTATGECLTGWLASQSDILSEDWVIV